MSHKIVFIRNTQGKSSGVRARCENVHPKTQLRCTLAQGHVRNCRWTVMQKLRTSPRTNRVVSHITKLSCLEMIEDPLYRKQLLKDLRARKLRPAVECMLWYYAKGKPKEMVEHSGTLSLQEELSSLSAEQLRARALEVARMISQDTSTRVH